MSDFCMNQQAQRGPRCRTGLRSSSCVRPPSASKQPSSDRDSAAAEFQVQRPEPLHAAESGPEPAHGPDP
eukprot:4297215-Heterocapsa_arctica.AAC.1